MPPLVPLAMPMPPFPTGNVPVTSVVSVTCAQVGGVPPCTTVVVVAQANVVGAAPAPPPTMIWFTVSAADDAMTVALEKYATPPEVAEVGCETVAQVGAAVAPDSSGRFAV